MAHVNISSFHDVLPGGEGESEEDEEDEPVTELKKPNSDEVMGDRGRTGPLIGQWAD